MHFGGARGSQDRPGYPRGRSCARPAPTPRQRPRPSGPSGKHPPHRGGGKSRLSYPEARSLELDGSRRGPFCRARALLQGVKRARCPCPGAGGRRRCRTHIYSGSPNCSSRDAAAATHRQKDEAPGVLPPPKGRRVRQLSPFYRFCCVHQRRRGWSATSARTRPCAPPPVLALSDRLASAPLLPSPPLPARGHPTASPPFGVPAIELGPRSPRPASARPALLPAAARSVSPASTRSKPEPAGRISLAAANRPLLRSSAAPQPRRPPDETAAVAAIV